MTRSSDTATCKASWPCSFTDVPECRWFAEGDVDAALLTSLLLLTLRFASFEIKLILLTDEPPQSTLSRPS
eukprot:m.188189 g.188189  ORF g.188189 m.188189 type:complete len:71 (-) comp16721_c1_seq2:318-530(-)